MAEFEPVQVAARTTTGTMDFTKSGFGTPIGALFFVTRGLSNGTVADHAILGMGATDGVRNIAHTGRSKDGIALGTSLCANQGETALCIYVDNQDGTDIFEASFDSFITDGIRINVTVAPSSAFLVTCVLIGGSGVTNIYCATATTPATIDTGTDITAPNFEPTAVLVFGSGPASWASSAHNYLTFGVCVNDGANPHPQFSMNFEDVSALSTTFVASILCTNRVYRDLNPTSGREIELQDFDSQGFSAFTRALGASAVFGYVAIKLSGLQAKVMAIDSPTATGSWQISGIGFTPQYAMFGLGAVTTNDSRVVDANAEVFGIGVATAAAQYCMAATSDDAVTTTTNAESVVDSEPFHLIKDGATFFDANFSSWGSGVANFNVNTEAFGGTARKWFGFFVEASTGGADQHEPFVKVLIK